MPVALDKPKLEVESHTLHVLKADSTAVHVPDLGARLPGDVICNGVHVWMYQSDHAQRMDWIETINGVEKLGAKTIITVHTEGKGVSACSGTRAGEPDQADPGTDQGLPGRDTRAKARPWMLTTQPNEVAMSTNEATNETPPHVSSNSTENVTDDGGRRWYHLRPDPRRRTDLMGFNSTWWMAVGWLIVLLLIVFPFPWWW